MSDDYDEIMTKEGPAKVQLPETAEEWGQLDSAVLRPSDGKEYNLGSAGHLLGEGFAKIYCTQADEFKRFLLEKKSHGLTLRIDEVLEEFDKHFGTTINGIEEL